MFPLTFQRHTFHFFDTIISFPFTFPSSLPTIMRKYCIISQICDCSFGCFLFKMIFEAAFACRNSL
jgi:hypothetical protein